MEPKVSVIVPVYNVENYIENCLLSIINQTYTNLEIIVIDDGSCDMSGDICDKYKDIDRRILVYHKVNEGLAAARNDGLDRATGAFISFVDSDDTIEPNMIEVLYQAMVTYNTDMSFCDYYRTSSKSDEQKSTYDKIDMEVYSKSDLLDLLFQREFCILLPVAWNKLYKRELFEKLRYPKDRYHEDEFIIHKIVYSVNTAVYTKIKLYNYQIREESITKISNYKMKNDQLDAYKDRADFFKNNADKEFYRLSITFYLKQIIWLCLKNNANTKESKAFINQQAVRVKEFIVTINRDYLSLVDRIKYGLFSKCPYHYINIKKFIK